MFLESDRAISYILCTKNKLRYLQSTVPDLIAGAREIDEIIVFDGKSTDGSREYLEELSRSGKFRVFRSESDFNQAHGLNKAMLCARGEVLKVVLDDDILDYEMIRRCADFLIKHPQIDVLGANIGLAHYKQTCSIVRDVEKQPQFERWMSGSGEPFWFQDQCFTFRRASLPIVGFWNTGVNCIDLEMTLKLTTLRQAKIAWYTGLVAVHLLNEGSLGLNTDYILRLPKDVRRIYRYHGLAAPPVWGPNTAFEKLRAAVRLRTRLRKVASAGRKTVELLRGSKEKANPPTMPFEEAYTQCKKWLAENREIQNAVFLFS